jgi:hypothetical protein
MRPIHAEASRIIDAHPEEVYAILADYQSSHPAILPKPYFAGIEVEQGGLGAGTVVNVRMKAFGMEQKYRLSVTEPEPGRVLVEEDEEAGVTTTFTLDPVDDGQATRVTIATDMRPSRGVAGWFERLIDPPFLRNIYQAELQQIADYVRQSE